MLKPGPPFGLGTKQILYWSMLYLHASKNFLFCIKNSLLINAQARARPPCLFGQFLSLFVVLWIAVWPSHQKYFFIEQCSSPGPPTWPFFLSSSRFSSCCGRPFGLGIKKNLYWSMLFLHASKKVLFCIKKVFYWSMLEDRRPKTKDRRPKAKDQRPKPKDQRPKTKDQRPKTKDQRPKTKDQRLETKETRATSKESIQNIKIVWCNLQNLFGAN